MFCDKYKFYNLYGLIIRSKIPLHKSLLIEPTETYDVDILIGTISLPSCTPLYNYGVFKYYKDVINITIDNIGTFNIINCSKIVVQPIKPFNYIDLCKYICGSCLGILLFQREILALHGGALSINDKGIVICGNIGAGKTSLVANLISRNHRFLSDDVSPIITDKLGVNCIFPSFPKQKLCIDTALNLGYDINELELIDITKNKYYSPIIKNFSKEPVEFNYLFYLNCGDFESLTFEEITGIGKFKIVVNNIYRCEFIPKELYSPIFTKKCLLISSKIKLFKINRPRNIDTLDEITNYIENKVNKI